MTVTQAAIDRTELGAADLIIGVAGSGPQAYLFTEDGMGEPSRIPVVTVEANPFVDGGLPTQMRLDVSALEWKILVCASSASELRSRMDDLIEAISEQFAFTVTTTLDGGTPQVWNCFAGPVSLADGVRREEWVAGYVEKLALTIPCQPKPGA